MNIIEILPILAFLLISVFSYIYFRSRNRKKEVSLKDLYRTSKSKKLGIAKSKERKKKEKEDFIQYEISKKIESDVINYDADINSKVNNNYSLKNVSVDTFIEKVLNNDLRARNSVQKKIEEDYKRDFNNIEKLLEEAKTSSYKFHDKKIDIIDGIGSSYRQRLGEIGISTISDFLSAANQIDGFKKINEETGIYTKLLKKWYVKADLSRIQGIRNDQIEKLLFIGITSSKQLAHNNPKELLENLLENNSFSETPTLSMIKRWVRIAKEIEIIDNKT